MEFLNKKLMIFSKKHPDFLLTNGILILKYFKVIFVDLNKKSSLKIYLNWIFYSINKKRN